VIGVCINIAYLLSVLIYPYMPNISLNIRRQLNLNDFNVVREKEDYDGDNIRSDVYSYPKFVNKFYNFIREGHKIGKAEPLFKRIGEADVKLWKEKFGGPQTTTDDKDSKAKKDKKQKNQPKEKPKNDSSKVKTQVAEVKSQNTTDSAH